MDRVQLVDGRLEVPETGPVYLPDPLNIEIIDAIFACDAGEAGHIAELHQRMPDSEKQRFERACKEAGEPYTRLWNRAACDWASVGAGTDDGTWDLSALKVCFVEKIDSWLVDSVIATEHGLWFVLSPKHGVLSRAEFLYILGQDLEEHLNHFIRHETTKVERVIAALNLPFVEREFQVSTADGLRIVRRKGPPNIPVSEWKLAPGETFISEL